MKKLVLIEKYFPLCPVWPNLEKMKKIPELSVQEILNKYQGFEGECFLSLSIEQNNFDDAVKLFQEVPNWINYEMLYLNSDEIKFENKLNEIATFKGFDIGICEDEITVYSSIFNEILFGYFEELISFRYFLNENYLFPNKLLCERYLNTHEELAEKGKGVEQGVEMTIYEIWKFNKV